MSKAQRLVQPALPKSSAAAFAEITKILKMGWIPIPDQKSYNFSRWDNRDISTQKGKI